MNEWVNEWMNEYVFIYRTYYIVSQRHYIWTVLFAIVSSILLTSRLWVKRGFYFTRGFFSCRWPEPGSHSEDFSAAFDV